MVGVSHQERPIAVRERMHVPSRRADEIRSGLAAEGVASVVLSTCNRTELYLAETDDVRATAAAFAAFRGLTGFDDSRLRSALSVIRDREAATHLFAVAGGLESLVVGETQVLGQIRAAHRAAVEERTSGPVLDRLFRQALQTGRRIRSETALADRPGSVPAAAVRLAEAVVGPLDEAGALVIGAGRMGELVLLSLLHRGCRRISVANRSTDRAERVARRFGAEPVALDRAQKLLVGSDLVISCTASEGIVLSADDVRRAVANRKGRSMFLVDVAVPRDLDPGIAAIDGAYLYDIDDLAPLVAEARADRGRDLARARAIVEEEAGRFVEWQRSRDVVPAIVSLRRRADEIRLSELRRAEARLGRLSTRERRHVELLTAQIMSKFLHEPTVRMKRAAIDSAGPAYAGAVQHLFGSGERPT